MENKQYCRYCAACFEGDALFCSVYDKILTKSAVCRANKCKNYYCIGIDVFTGEPRKKHKSYIKQENNKQISLFEKGGT